MTSNSSVATVASDVTAHPDGEKPHLGEVVYRFVGRLGPLNPVGLFDEGIRFHNVFEGRVVEGPFAGGTISGPDFFVLRNDGVGEIHAPELIEADDVRVALDVRGYVVAPEDMAMPPLETLLDPDFTFPDVAFRITGSALAATAAPGFAWLNQMAIVIEGQVNMGTGEMDVTARTIEPASGH